MRIGVTGRRTEPTDNQQKLVKCILTGYDEITRFNQLNHGDCLGADEFCANYIENSLHKNYIRVNAYPGPVSKYSANAYRTYTHDMFGNLDRNKLIVANSDLLIAIPDKDETLRSGTWATVRYARQKGIPVIILDWK